MSFPAGPPAPEQVAAWQFPVAVEHQIPGGPLLRALRVPGRPVVCVRWSFRGGRTLLDESECAQAALLQTLPRRGTQRFDQHALAETVDHLGARPSVQITADSAVVTVMALSEHLDQALDLADELALRPTHPADQVAAEVARFGATLDHALAQPEVLAQRAMGRLVHPDHPYGWPGITRAALAQAAPPALAALHRRLFHPARGMLCVVGDVDPQAMVARLLARVGPTAPAQAPQTLAQRVGPASGTPATVLIDRPDAQQVGIHVGQVLFGRSHPDYLAVRLGMQVLGGGASGRLFMELRERRSLTYGAYAAVDCGMFGGDLEASLRCAPEKATEAVAALRAELRRMVDAPVDAEEVEHARRMMLGGFPQHATGVGGVAALSHAQWLFGLPADAWTRHLAGLAQLDLAAVQAATRRWLRPEALQWVLVGPEPVLRAAAVGPVTLLTARDLGGSETTG